MKKVHKAYRYRFYPTDEQKKQLARTFGCARFVYNYFLRVRTDSWSKEQKRVGYNETAKLLTGLKKEEETIWLQDVSNVVLQQSLRNLDTAFKNFFQGNAKYPKFKKKMQLQSARYTASGFSFKGGQIKLAKHKEPLKIKWSRQFTGKPTNCTVSMDSSGRYHISILVKEEVQLLPVTKKEVGIDLGLTHVAITSDGMKFNNHKYYVRAQKRLRRAQKLLSRKEKGSNNRAKAKLKVAKIHAKIAEQRQDFAHKLTSMLIHENQVIATESLQVKNMLKNSKLSKSISDVGWFQIINMLTYKANWYGRSLVQIDKFYPSSKRCCSCGHVLEQLPLSVRSWDCPSCGSTHDRDINAAQNILKAGKAILAGADALRVYEKSTVGHTGI